MGFPRRRFLPLLKGTGKSENGNVSGSRQPCPAGPRAVRADAAQASRGAAAPAGAGGSRSAPSGSGRSRAGQAGICPYPGGSAAGTLTKWRRRTERPRAAAGAGGGTERALAASPRGGGRAEGREGPRPVGAARAGPSSERLGRCRRRRLLAAGRVRRAGAGGVGAVTGPLRLGPACRALCGTQPWQERPQVTAWGRRGGRSAGVPAGHIRDTPPGGENLLACVVLGRPRPALLQGSVSARASAAGLWCSEAALLLLAVKIAPRCAQK